MCAREVHFKGGELDGNVQPRLFHMRPADAVAVVCSDIHLSHKAPLLRTAEPDWYEAMRNALGQVQALANKLDVPVLFAGDLFDKWNSPAELINFAHRCTPTLIGIPGQHDIPYHNYGELHKSAYMTLENTGAVRTIAEDDTLTMRGIKVSASAWGKPIPHMRRVRGHVNVCLIHAYCWKGKASHPNAAKDKDSKSWRDVLYENNIDLGIFGDNHIGFQHGTASIGKTAIFNCGGLMRRSVADLTRDPMVGVLHCDGVVTPYYLDTMQDKYLELEEIVDNFTAQDHDEFIESLRELGTTTTDWLSAVNEFLMRFNLPKKTNDIILRAVEKGKRK